MADIFISYRREDSDVAAGRLADDLSEIFGADAIFRDIDTLEPGEDYEKALDRALDYCKILIVVIGPRWSAIVDKAGHRRLGDPKDWVRAEISRALARGIRVIPVLVSGAVMPGEEDVPGELRPLLKRQAFELEDRHWKQDVKLLAQTLERIPGIRTRDRTSHHLPDAVGRVTLVGSKQWFIINPQIKVFVDDQEVAHMKLSDEITLGITPGVHRLFVEMPLNASNTVGFYLVAGEGKRFAVSVRRLTGQLTLSPLTQEVALR